MLTNDADVLCAEVMINPHPVVPVQEPTHWLNSYPKDGVAVRVTLVPSMKLVEHVPGQEMPAGELTTVPPPATVTVRFCGAVLANS